MRWEILIKTIWVILAWWSLFNSLCLFGSLGLLLQTRERQLYIPQFSVCFKTQKKKQKKEKNRKLKNLKDNSCRLNMDTAYCMEWFWAFYSCFLYFAFHFIFMQHYLSFEFSLEISRSYLVLIYFFILYLCSIIFLSDFLWKFTEVILFSLGCLFAFVLW